MTVKTYIKKFGWNVATDDEAGQFHTVDIGFTNNLEYDETEFDIEAYNVKELESLWKEFCKENGINSKAITNITIVAKYDEVEETKSGANIIKEYCLTV